jgi:hypothetical protein
MKNTTNYSLLLPDKTDFYNVADQNANMEVVDAQMKANQTAAANVTANYNAHAANKSNPHGVTKGQVGLGNVPNVATNDQTPTYTVPSALSALVSGEKISIALGKLAKSVSSIISHLADKSNPHGVTKAQIGLGSVTNTADADKPVSTAQKTAIDAVQTNLNTHTANVSNPHGVTKAQVGLGNVSNTSDANKPISTAQQAAFNSVNARIDAYETVGQLGSPKIVTVTGENLDNYVTAGVYCFAAGYVPTNNPPGNTNGWLIVIPWQASGNTCKQIWLRHGTPDSTEHSVYIRTRIGGTWYAWREVLTEKTQLAYMLGEPNGTIAENSNLNNYRTPGVYSASGNGIGSTIANTPTTLNFKLIVECVNSDTFIYQTVISRIGKRWTRLYDSTTSTWTDWVVNYINNVKEITMNGNGELVVTRADGTVATFKPASMI